MIGSTMTTHERLVWAAVDAPSALFMGEGSWTDSPEVQEHARAVARPEQEIVRIEPGQRDELLARCHHHLAEAAKAKIASSLSAMEERLLAVAMKEVEQRVEVTHPGPAHLGTSAGFGQEAR